MAADQVCGGITASVASVCSVIHAGACVPTVVVFFHRHTNLLWIFGFAEDWLLACASNCDTEHAFGVVRPFLEVDSTDYYDFSVVGFYVGGYGLVEIGDVTWYFVFGFHILNRGTNFIELKATFGGVV
jgi:hypothetical protein